MKRREHESSHAPLPWRSYRAWAPVVVAAVLCACTALAQPPEKKSESGQSAGAPPKEDSTAEASPSSDEAEAIKRLIQQRMEQNAKSAAERPTASPAPKSAPDQPATTQPTKGKGCGGSTDTGKPDLTPPAAGQPQPRWVCENETIELPPIWRGQPAEFVFKVRNEGEGVLTFTARGG